MTDNELGLDAGAVYVFKFDGVSWTQSQKLLASDGGTSQMFGWDVAMQGRTAVVAAVGKAYVLAEIDGQWIEQQILFPADGTPGFGRTVAIDGDVIVVATPADNTQGGSAGAAWVFRYDGEAWLEEQKILASDGSAGNQFGTWPALAVQGNVIAIGAPSHEGLNPPPNPPLSLHAGAAYIFTYDGKQWTEQQIISPFDVQSPSDSTNFGKALAMRGDLLVVSNPNDDNLSTFVYQYDAQSDKWVQQQQIMPPPGAQADGFGRALAVENQTILIADWLYSGDGAVFVYKPDETKLWQVADLLAPKPNGWSNFFGRHIALDNGRVLIGANGEDQQSGAAYIFDLSCGADPIPGDVNGDGVVNFDDVLAIIFAWGGCPASPAGCPADLDGDGDVDFDDLLIVLFNWT